jgi:hypothetical protein
MNSFYLLIDLYFYVLKDMNVHAAERLIKRRYINKIILSLTLKTTIE